MFVKGSKRVSNVELLRILAMFFIVCSHCSVHSDLPSAGSSLQFNDVILDWLTLGNLGADLFILISGYFLCSSQNFNRTKSEIKLLSQVWFYSALGLGIYLITGHQLTPDLLLPSLFPTVFSEYWFFTIYVVFIAFLPYVNTLLNKLDRTKLLQLIIIMMVFWSIIPTFTAQRMYGNELCQFVMFYSIGAYFRKFPDNFFAKKKIRYILICVSSVLMLVSAVALRIVVGKYSIYFFQRHSILTVGCAIGLFSSFIYMKPFCNKWINLVAKCTLGVYLFHDHPLVREILWHEWLPKIAFYQSNLLIFVIILSVLIVMAAGTVIELIREATIQQPLERFLYSAVVNLRCALRKRINDLKEKTVSVWH